MLIQAAVLLMFIGASASTGVADASVGPVDVPVDEMPTQEEVLFVVGEGPVIAPVEPGQAVSVIFGVGELDVEAQPVREVRAVVEVRCRPRREARCDKAKKRLRVEPRQTAEGLEVRLTGMNKYLLRRLEIDAKIIVPYDSPLDVRAGIGDVEIRGGSERLTVRMGIGDLRVRAPEKDVKSVRVRTRIGDAGLRNGEGHRAGSRRTLIGAGLRWSGGDGTEPIDVWLRIGDAQVILE